MPVSRLRDEVKFHIESYAAARAHFASRAGEASRAHVLNANNSTRMHGFEARFEQQPFP